MLVYIHFISFLRNAILKISCQSFIVGISLIIMIYQSWTKFSFPTMKVMHQCTPYSGHIHEGQLALLHENIFHNSKHVQRNKTDMYIYFVCMLGNIPTLCLIYHTMVWKNCRYISPTSTENYVYICYLYIPLVVVKQLAGHGISAFSFAQIICSWARCQ